MAVYVDPQRRNKKSSSSTELYRKKVAARQKEEAQQPSSSVNTQPKQENKPVDLAGLFGTIGKTTGDVAGWIGDNLFSGSKKLSQALHPEFYDMRSKMIDDAEKAGVPRDIITKERQKLIDDYSWVGNKDEKTGAVNYNTSVGDNAKKAFGVTLEAGSELAPIPIGKFAKGASLATKAGKSALGGAIASGVGSAGSQLVSEGRVSPSETLADLAAGGVVGGAIPIVSKAAGKVFNAIKDKIPGVHAQEPVIKTESIKTIDRKAAANELPAKANKSLLDKNAPVKQLSNAIEDLTGKKINIKDDPYQLMKLRAGTEGQIVTHLQDTASWLKDVPKDIRADGDAYGYAKQFLSQGSKRTPEQLALAKNTIDKMQQKYGDTKVLDDYVAKTRQTFDTIVDLYEQNGVISKDLANKFRSNPDYFAKMEVLQDETEKILGASGTINVRNPSAFQKIKGQKTGDVLAHSADAYVKQTTRAFNDIARNRVGLSVGKLADQLPEGNGLILKPKGTNKTFSDKQVPKDYTKISYIENGERKEVAVPKEVGDVLTGADQEQFDAITTLMGKVNNIFRQAVTTYNPLFTFWRNPVRDFKSFLTNSRYVPVRRAVWDYSAGLMDALTNGQATKDFLRAGGGQAGYLVREGGQAGKMLAHESAKLTGDTSKLWKAVKSPYELYKHVAQAIENAPRVAEFKGAKRAGRSAEEAAIAGREVTVDFAQGGKLSKLVNQWVPFLNARAQGTRRLAAAFKENPRRAATVFALTTAAPMAGLMAWNNQFRNEWDSIPDYEKENNFLFILSNHRDESGRLTDVIRIPKGDVDKIMGNTLETMLNQFSKGGGNLDDWLKTGVSSLSNLSPVNFANNGELSMNALLSSGLPAPVKAGIQASTNTDFFKDEKIVPDSLKGAPVEEQFKSNTSDLAKNLGKALGISPLQIDTALQALAGSLPTDISSGGQSLVDRSQRGLTGAAGNKGLSQFYDVMNPVKDTKDYRLNQIYKLIDQGKYGEAQRTAQDYNKYVDETFQKYFNTYSDIAPQEIYPGENITDTINNLKIDVAVSKKGKPYVKR